MLFTATVIVIFVTSCTNIKETPLSDTLVKETGTVEGRVVSGVKTTDGKEIIPMEYDNVDLFEKYIAVQRDLDHYLYTAEGEKILSAPASSIIPYDEYIKFNVEEGTVLYFKENARITKPYAAVGDNNDDFLFCQGDSIEVISKKGKTLVAGKKVICLFSKADKQSYFIVVSGKSGKAFGMDGTELFPVNVELLEKLPRASWKLNENACHVSTRNEVAALKAATSVKRAPKKRK